MSTLTPLEKWSYAIGNMPFAVKDVAFNSFVVFYYTQVQGLSGSLTGLAMFIALSWDAVTDPFVGSWCDTVRSRWGRRHPLLLVGGVPTAPVAGGDLPVVANLRHDLFYSLHRHGGGAVPRL
jgi:Na+/melibiose symporter-like transporter